MGGWTKTTTRSAVVPTRGAQRVPEDPSQLADLTYANSFKLHNFRLPKYEHLVRWKCSFETDFCGLVRNSDCVVIRKDYTTGRVLNSTYIPHGKFSRGKIGAKHTGKKVQYTVIKLNIAIVKILLDQCFVLAFLAGHVFFDWQLCATRRPVALFSLRLTEYCMNVVEFYYMFYQTGENAKSVSITVTACTSLYILVMKLA